MRMTRAALRAQASQESLAFHEDEDATQELAADQENDARPALKDITEENAVGVDSLSEAHAPTKKVRGQKRNTTKMYDHDDITVQEPAILASRSDIEPEASPPEIASEITAPAHVSEGLGATSETSSPSTPLVSNTESGTLPEGTHAPEIAEEPNNDLVAVSKTPKFIPDIYEPTTTTMAHCDDSFVHSIKSRTPGKLSAEFAEHEDDSFVDKIISRTPRPASRIEDSVEAMDRLEDAIEQFSGELPILDDLRIESPTKEHAATPTKTPASTRKAAVGASSLKKASSPPRRSPSKSPSKPSTQTLNKPAPVAAAKTTTITVRTANARPSTIKPAAKISVVKKPGARVVAPATTQGSRPAISLSKPSSNTQPNAIKKRAPSDTLSTSRPGFVPAKSTKPATQSTFTLPGEAYSAKMKAQREERQRKEEEAAAAKRQFKARPAPSASGRRPSVLPRENKASQARLSRVFSGNNKENVEPKPVTSRRPVSMVLDVKKVRTEPNSSIRRTASVNSKNSSSTSREPKFAANVPRVASLTSKPVVPKEDSAAPGTHKKVSGKEVFGRSKLELKKQEDEKREKEEAARKARAEAAERGRLASREWAEKQKARLVAQKVAKATAQETVAAV